MEIKDALKLSANNIDIYISCGSKRMYWNDEIQMWEVREYIPYSIHTSAVICAVSDGDEDVALRSLIDRMSCLGDYIRHSNK